MHVVMTGLGILVFGILTLLFIILYLHTLELIYKMRAEREQPEEQYDEAPDWDEIEDDLVNSTKSVEAASLEWGVSKEAVQAEMKERGYKQCECGWWVDEDRCLGDTNVCKECPNSTDENYTSFDYDDDEAV